MLGAFQVGPSVVHLMQNDIHVYLKSGLGDTFGKSLQSSGGNFDKDSYVN